MPDTTTQRNVPEVHSDKASIAAHVPSLATGVAFVPYGLVKYIDLEKTGNHGMTISRL